MKYLIPFFLFLCASISRAEMPSAQCEELNKRATATMARMDSAIQLKTGFLLGEIQMSKESILRCIDLNKGVETRASLLWFLTELGMVLVAVLTWMHHRKMKRAILALNKTVSAGRPEHSATYMPSQWFMRSLVLSLIVGFVSTNLVALFL